MNAWMTHLPALLCAFAATSGAVIELGVGFNSTPILHALCMTACRNLISIEADEGWIREFRGSLESDRHRFYLGDYETLVPQVTDGLSFGVGFVDNSPGGIRRKTDFQTLIKCCDIVVVHDYHLENSEAINTLLDGLNHHVCTRYQPPTLICAARGMNIPNSVKVF